MYGLSDVLDTIWGPFAKLVGPEGSLYWLYLISTAGIAFIIYWLRRYGKEEVSITGFLSFFFPKRIYAHTSAKLDFKFFAVNAILVGAFIAPLLLSSLTVSRATIGVLVDLFGIPEEPILEGVAAQIAATTAVVIAADLGFYVSHYLQHKVPFLWEFHKVHHSAEVLHPIAAFRAHPVDQVLDTVLMGAMTGLVLGVSAYGFGTSTGLVTLVGMNAFVFLFNFAGSHLRHSHIWLSYGPRLEHIFVSPALHQIHHSLAARHLDKNLGGMLSIWDRLMGTLYVPREQENLTFGLAAGEHSNYTTVVRLYLVPLQKSARLCLRMFQRNTDGGAG